MRTVPTVPTVLTVPTVPTVLTALTALSLLSAACSDSVTPPEPLSSLRVAGRVLDQAGDPLAGGYALLHVWYSDGAKDVDHVEPPFDALGSDGAFSLASDFQVGLDIDSVGIEAVPPGCGRAGSMAVIAREDLPEGPVGEITLDLTAPEVPPAATTTPGLLCAEGAEPDWGFGSYSLYLRIDATDGPVLTGRWSTIYRRSTAGFDGTFTGVEQDGLVVLTLTQPQVGLGCTELRLVMTVGGSGEWGIAQIAADDGCLPAAAELRFMKHFIDEMVIPPL